MNEVIPDYLFSADYRNNNFVKATAEYYEVTKTGVVKHEDIKWKTPSMNGYTINSKSKITRF